MLTNFFHLLSERDIREIYRFVGKENCIPKKTLEEEDEVDSLQSNK